MPDVLSQKEIDDMLNHVDTSMDSSLNLDVNPVLKGNAAGAVKDTSAADYDFKRPERVSTDQIRSIWMLHEALARKLGASLSAYLRTIVEVKLASVEQLTYYEFIISLPNPTCFNLLTCEPLDGSMVLEMNPSIVYPILDKLLGGGNTGVHIPEREMSNIEWRLIDFVTKEALKFLSESWRPIMDIEFKVVQNEAKPELMQIVPPNEVVILISFEVHMGESKGMLNLCVPFPVVEPIMANFSTVQTWFTSRRNDSGEVDKRNLKESMAKITMEGVAYLAQTKITMRQFLRLKPGDIITTPKDSKESLLLTVAGKPKFRGHIGKFRKHMAFQISRTAECHEGI